MYSILDKTKQDKPREFYLLNDKAQVFAGLRGGYPLFVNNWDEAKPLNNDNQVKLIARGTDSTEFEKYYI